MMMKRLLLIVLTLVAVNTQQLVAQTHWHAFASTPAQLHADVAAPDPVAPGNLRDDCLLCQIAAHAGAAAPPAAIVLAVADCDDHAIQVQQLADLVPVPQPAHAWQSRGPPTA